MRIYGVYGNTVSGTPLKQIPLGQRRLSVIAWCPLLRGWSQTTRAPLLIVDNCERTNLRTMKSTKTDESLAYNIWTRIRGVAISELSACYNRSPWADLGGGYWSCNPPPPPNHFKCNKALPAPRLRYSANVSPALPIALIDLR